jgi:E3 ubiquitin-protein ligase UBR2
MPSSSYENDTQTETEQAMKERRAKLAALRREQLMAQMAKAQKSFITSHAEHFKDDDDDKVEEDASMDWQATVEERKTNCIGRDRMMVHNEAETFTCILCSEESPCNRDCMVYPAFIQRSSVLSRYQTTTDDTNQLSSIETAIHASPYVSSCGHEMHVNCWKEYFNNEMLKEQRRPFRTRNPSIFNIDKNQFLCPLCRFLSNTVLPIIPPLNSLGEVKAESFETIFNFDKWHTLMSNYIDSLQFLKPNDPDSFDETEQQTEELMKNYKECVVGFLKTNFNFDETQISEALNLNPDICDYTLKFVKNVKDIVPQSIDESDNDVDSFTVAWQTCAYTIQSLEMYMRAIDKPLKGEMSVRYEKCVSGLVRLCGTYGRFENNPAREIQMLPISYKSLLIYARDLFDNLFGRKPDSSILHWDVFSMMTSMLFTTRALIFPLNSQYQIPRGDSLDFTIFNTMFAVNLMKILVTAKVNCDTYMDSDEEISDNEEAVKISSIYESFNIYRTTNTDPTSNRNISSQLIQTLKDQSRTFLRCSCILFHFLTQVPLPDEMAMDDSFEVMAEYLNIDVNITNYFKDSSMLNFMIQCAQHKAVEVYYNRLKADEQNLIPIVPALAPIRQLVSLPDDYSDLINSVSTFTCKNNEREDSRNPTMCLVCGEVICSQTYCCQRELNKQQVGACNYHTEVCGAGAGIYLRIRDAEILLLGQSTGCFLSAPYLDDYGETDQGLRRGHPLHLDRESYKKLQLLWLGHGVHEDIARKTEAQSHIFQIQWTHL